VGATLAIAGLWLAFAGAHVVLSSATVRPRLVARLGMQAFQGLYSLAMIALFVPLVWVFAENKHAGPLVWTTIGPPAVARALAWTLNVSAFALLVCALVPTSAAPSSIGAADRRPRAHGILRITRHPLLAGFACWGIAHLLVNGHLGDIVFFGGFPVWVWIGARHQDARLARDRPGYVEFARETSLVPFAAIVAGKQRLVADEMPWASLATGVVAALALRHWHGSLFGP
jgi:uncharacterized membrane protein